MAITPKPPGSVDAPNTLNPEAAGSVAVPNTLNPEAAGTVAVPNDLTAQAAATPSVPNDLTAQAAASPGVPNDLTPEAAGSVAVPNDLTAQAATTPGAPNDLTPSDAQSLPRTLCPTVKMNFAESLFSQNGLPVTESSLLTYARGSSATFIDRQLGPTGRWEYFLNTEATGNVKRIGYDAATGENLGVLIEQASTNLCLRSEEFDNASWTKVDSAVTADNSTAPDLTVSADKLEAGSTASITPSIQQIVTTTAALDYSFSLFAKRSDASFLQITFANGLVLGNPAANFDLGAGLLGTVDPEITNAKIEDVGGGWYRISGTVTAATTAIRLDAVLIQSATDTRNQANSWTAGQGLFVWGAQIEQVAMHTSYIPTTTAAVSRLADQLSIPNASNMPLGDVTIYASIKAMASEGMTRFIYVPASTGSNIFGSIQNSGALAVQHGTSGKTVAISGAYGESFSLTGVFDLTANTLSGYLDGSQTVTGDAGTAGAVNSGGIFAIGSGTAFTAQLNGHIKELLIYDVAMTANEVAQL